MRLILALFTLVAGSVVRKEDLRKTPIAAIDTRQKLVASAAPAPAAAGPAAAPIDLNAPMPLKSQEQGVAGPLVQHVDGATKTADWRKEYGPKGPIYTPPANNGETDNNAAARSATAAQTVPLTVACATVFAIMTSL